MDFVQNPLDNPVFAALAKGCNHFCEGILPLRYFPKEVSPFLGMEEFNAEAIQAIEQQIPQGRTFLLARREAVLLPSHWLLKFQIVGTQFVYPSKNLPTYDQGIIQPLDQSHIAEMLQLTRLTKPGPFDTRTIEFGNYKGIFEDGKLVSMAGWRLQFDDYLEVSAVCTHPDYVGKGYARTLLQYQINSIVQQGKIPFLHSRADNSRAIDLYEGLGFVANGPMHFYFVQLPG